MPMTRPDAVLSRAAEMPLATREGLLVPGRGDGIEGADHAGHGAEKAQHRRQARDQAETANIATEVVQLELAGDLQRLLDFLPAGLVTAQAGAQNAGNGGAFLVTAGQRRFHVALVPVTPHPFEKTRRDDAPGGAAPRCAPAAAREPPRNTASARPTRPARRWAGPRRRVARQPPKMIRGSHCTASSKPTLSSHSYIVRPQEAFQLRQQVHGRRDVETDWRRADSSGRRRQSAVPA